MQVGKTFALAPRVDRIPKRRKTSEQVTKMDRIMRMMMIQVRPKTTKVSRDVDQRKVMIYLWGENESIGLTGHLVVSDRVRQDFGQV